MKQNSESKKTGREKIVEDKQQAALKVQQEQLKQLGECVAIASATPEGIVAFRQLMNMCGYNLSSMVIHPQTGIVNTEGTIYNVGRENIWKEIRQLIPVKTRKKIEYEKTIYLEGGE